MEPSFQNYSTEIPPESPEEESQPSGLFRFFVDILETLILSVLLFVGINAISARIRVDGSSMEPSLHTGEFVIVNRLAYKFNPPTQGDVIVFHFPRDPDQEYIKRTIGLPGEEVKVMDGRVYVDEQPLDEPYIAAAPRYQGNWQVPADQLFVLGDNRNNSSDSHNWGAVPMENVIGKAIFIYWPPPDWGLIPDPGTVQAADSP
jgi:signal peptidase I